MNQMMKNITFAKLSFTHYFMSLCHGHAPMEIIKMIMDLLIDTLKPYVFFYDNHYYLSLSGNVYGITYFDKECHNLYKVAHMSKVRKMVYGHSKIYFIHYDNELYLKSTNDSIYDKVTKVMSNVLDIQYNKYLYVLTIDKKLIKIVGNERRMLLCGVDMFDCYSNFSCVMVKGVCYLGINDVYSTIDIKDVVSIKITLNSIYLLTKDGIVYRCHSYNSLSIVPLPKIIKMDSYKEGIVFLDINHCAHMMGEFMNKTKYKPKLILNNVIDICCKENAMLLTKDLNIYISNYDETKKIFSFV